MENQSIVQSHFSNDSLKTLCLLLRDGLGIIRVLVKVPEPAQIAPSEPARSCFCPAIDP